MEKFLSPYLAPSVARLAKEWERRRRSDPSLTMRKFASLIGLSSGALSELMTGKRTLTAKMAARIANRLLLSPHESRRWFSQVVEGQAKDGGGADEIPGSVPHQLENETFAAISEWHYYAILSLSEVRGSKADPTWIARRLGISPARAKSALARLERLGMVRVEKGRFFQTKTSLTTSHNVSSLALRRFHSQLLEQAAVANKTVPVSERHLSTMTFATSSARMQEAQEQIREFQRTLCAFLEKGPKERVYTLAIQFFPIDKGEDDENEKRK